MNYRDTFKQPDHLEMIERIISRQEDVAQRMKAYDTKRTAELAKERQAKLKEAQKQREEIEKENKIVRERHNQFFR